MKKKTENNPQLFSFSFEPIKVNSKERAARRLQSKITKYRKVHHDKITDDVKIIQDWISRLGNDEQLQLLSNVIDAPNIIEAVLAEIEEIYIATWSITPAGVSALEHLCASPILKDAVLLIDRIHSYKWVFANGIYDVIKDKIRIKVCSNHSKFICFKTVSGGGYLISLVQ